LTGTGGQLRRWVEMLTCLELDDRQGTHALSVTGWEQRKAQLERLGIGRSLE
jgi:hypothetical protein